MVSRRLANRLRRHPGEYLSAALVGLFVAWAVLQSFGGHAGWQIPAIAAVAVVVGCPLLAGATALTGLVQQLVRRGDYFWESVLPSRPLESAYGIVSASFYALVSMLWGMGIVMMFGTRPT